MFNQGIRARVLYMDAEITTGDMLLVAKNNYFWAADYDGIDFIANGDVAVGKRISEVTEEYGFRFADVTLEFPDYNNAEIDAKIILDALYAESPALSREQNNNLYLRVMDDYAHITRKVCLLRDVPQGAGRTVAQRVCRHGIHPRGGILKRRLLPLALHVVHPSHRPHFPDKPSPRH